MVVSTIYRNKMATETRTWLNSVSFRCWL